MSIKEANTISLIQLLDILGCHPIDTPDLGNDVWYRSPFRPAEKSTNFHVDKRRNVWYDFILNKGGNNIEFIKAYNNCDDGTALAFINDYFKAPQNFNLKPIGEGDTPRKERFNLKEVKPLTTPALLTFLTDDRKIKISIAKKFLVEVLYANNEDKKEYYALALKNESNGYEIQNKYFEGFLGKKDITILRGEQPTENTVSVFTNIWDFLAAAEYYSDVITAHDIIITHHEDFFEKALRLVIMRKYIRVFTYFANNEAGEGQTKLYQEALGKNHEPCFGFYYPFEGFHQYWKAQRKK